MATSDAPTQPTCPLGVSERTLSALRDDALRQSEAARLAAHVETCATCRARLAAFDDLAALLRSERPPEPDERLWQAVAATTSPPRLHLRFPGGAPFRVSWSGAATVAAALLLIIGFVALLGLRRPAPPTQPAPTTTPAPALTPTPTATPQPTATPLTLLPAHPLAWNTGSMPPSAQSVIFASDGESGYACNVSANLLIWRTYNRGASWVPAQVVPNDPSMNACELVVDASDPSVAALAWQPRGGGAGDGFTGLMTTVDGGATWQAVSSQPFTRIDQLDSRRGVIYALRETTDSSNSVAYHLWASGDRMRAWFQIDHGLPSDVAGFWLQPDGPAILIVVSDPATNTSQLWLSPDGATWRPLSVPGGLPFYRPARSAGVGSAPNGIVARWLQGQFHICVSNSTLGTTDPNSPPSTVTCSTDSGATWHARPLLSVTTADGRTSGGVNLLAISNDGAVLAYGLSNVYRLAAGSNRWQSLGPLPTGAQPSAMYCSSPGAGILWTLSQYAMDRVYIASYTP